MSDQMVLRTQEWLNVNYTGKTGYTPIPETGYTGWTTIYALLHALQIELGITATADNFGEGTISRFNERYPNGVKQQEYPSDVEENIYGIIQGALWCKGYSTGANDITKHFYDGTGNAIKSLKSDAGIDSTDSTVTLNIMKSLMSMDQFVLVNGGNTRIRVIQQRLNKGYEEYIGLCPCDGMYGRQMSKSLIITLQAIEGFTPSEATGNFGAGTKSRLPILPDTAGILDVNTVEQATDLVKYALICNGYNSNIEFGSYEWDAKLISVIKEFQKEMAIPQTGSADVDTWMALLLSRGNPDRACTACDTIYDVLYRKTAIDFLKNNGYEIIGRYINGTPAVKEFEPGELKLILESGLKYFPIYQRTGKPDITKFTTEMAYEDAFEASKGVVRNGIPKNAIVYFAVDFDAQDTDIVNYIIPYFRILANQFDSGYRIGIYGTRNVCTQVMEDNGSVVTCFVSDMSTGFSGNMGFRMPTKWNLDQFYELRRSTPIADRINVNYPTDFDLDRVAYSGRYPVESTCDFYNQPPKTAITNQKSIKWFNDNCIKTIEKYAVRYITEIKGDTIISPKRVALLVFDVLRHFKYDDGQWKLVLGNIDYAFLEYLANKYQEDEGKIFMQEFGHYMTDEDDAFLLVGENNSVIDIAHLAATAQAYYTTLFPKFWTGWGGDLATAMARVKYRIEHGDTLPMQEIADEVVGSGVVGSDGRRTPFNYSDICCDADAIKIAELVSNTIDYVNPVSIIIEEYYSNYVNKRYHYYIEDIAPLRVGSTDIDVKIYYLMNNIIVEGINVITMKGDGASEDIVKSCCKAFANYIMTEIKIN